MPARLGNASMGDFFVRRPIVAMVISIVMVLLGLVAMVSLPIAQYPEIVPPMVQVTTTFVGASSTDVEASVATPLEQKMNGVENMIYMKSTNANDGTLTLKVTFEVGTNLDIANVLTQNRLSEAMPSMPQAVKNYGVSVKKSLAFPLLVLTLSSPNGTYDNNFLSNYASINVVDALSRIPGVGQVNLLGGSDYALRVWLRPDRIAKLGITVPDIVKAINQQNQLSPAGQIGGPPAVPGTEYTYTVRTKGRLLNEEEFGDIIVRSNPDGSQVRLRDVARLELGTMLYNSIGRLNGNPAAVLALFQIPGTNAMEVAHKVEATMKQLAERFPNDLQYGVSLDTTLPVSEGINEIVHTLFEAVLLVILVVFVFLQNWRATIIPLLTVPVSLIGAFMFFPLLGFSINVLSLLGLVLAIGIVVDDAIVVVEAVMHHIEHGKTPREATLQAMKEVSGPVVAIALILTAVFVPVGFIPGITGSFYQQFAITIAISVLLSAFNALTLSPALSAMLLKPPSTKRHMLSPFYDWFNRVFGRGTDAYISFTGILVRKMVRSLILVGILMVLTVVLVGHIPAGFVPEEDQGFILVNAMLPDASALERTDRTMKKIESLLAENKAVKAYIGITGYSLITSAYSSNMGFFFVQLKDWAERKSAEEHASGVTAALNREFMQKVPEAIAIAFGPPAIPGLGTGSGFTMQLQDLVGNTPEYLAQQAQKFMAAARARPEIGRISSIYRSNVPQIFADIDRSKVLKTGVPLDDVNTTLGALLGSAYVNDFNRFGRVYKVYVQAEPEYRNSAEQLGLFFVRGAGGDMVPLNTLVSTKSTSGPEFTNRFNLYRSAEVTGVPAAGYSSAQALKALEEVAKATLPPDMGYQWADMSYQEKAAPNPLPVFAVAILLVFLVLAAQYESWALPFSVLLGTPFAAFGAYFGLWMAGHFSNSYVNNVFAQIGLIMLIGLAAKNAILIVEFARMLREQGKGIVESALEAARLRFRPILMTAFAFILGVVPLLTASGAGAEARKVMGMTVFSGMLIATLVGVCLIPVLFVAVEMLLARTSGKDTAPTTTEPSAPVHVNPEQH
jgi:HAE1 family hydrophobic/amphiphilic exporter-1